MIRPHRPRERVGIVGDPEPGAQHETLGGPVGQAKPRREHRLAHGHAEICRHRADAADHHHGWCRRRSARGRGPRGRHREVLPPVPREGNLRGRLPLVAHIEAVLPVACRIGLGQFQASDPVRYAEQERREGVVQIPSWASQDLRRPTLVAEPAASAKAVAAADLRLRMIQRLVVDVRAEPDVVSPFTQLTFMTL